MTLIYALKLGLKVCSINIWAQKIDCSIFKIFKMILANFQIEDKLKKVQFFQESFLLADISMKVVLKMPFFILINANI